MINTNSLLSSNSFSFSLFFLLPCSFFIFHLNILFFLRSLWSLLGNVIGTRQRIDCRAVISEQNHLSLLIQEVNVATDNEVHSSNHEDYDDDEEEEEKKKEKD
ncbi:uncharacterized protein LOC8271346 [Ricinus communis]|uniref:uncharacterized protein LOC8271346 n=1 Tax=Ricinus communis TaxID=3988 RepID=UPI000D68F4B4|nr:uncharacterized protein LOC8271346 [Ricinus communis]|eukprot:XP_025012830.1 uncharacterized protein LOC8271346 [Ricinus communis]